MVKAIAVLKGDSPVKGIVTFEQGGEGDPVKISGELSGMDPSSKRGFHIQGVAILSAFASLCLMGTPAVVTKHGGPDATERHVGDLGNVQTDKDGNVKLNMSDKHLSLFGAGSIIGRQVVVHAGEDDLGQGGNEESTKTGNAASCGVIGIAA